jgi:hypothetical protein
MLGLHKAIARCNRNPLPGFPTSIETLGSISGKLHGFNVIPYNWNTLMALMGVPTDRDEGKHKTQPRVPSYSGKSPT